jgi:ABC-type transport system involved in multi-copper enzyme maturation permease subunit
MAMRLGPGPVFVYEWLTTARRWQPYAMRAGFMCAILFGMTIVQSDRPMHARGPLVSLHDMAVIGEQTYRSITAIELILILLVAPAATAGAVCLDKARGTLDHMLATDLSNAEIVLGKLGVRLIPVFGLIACTLPVVALSGLLGGIEPLALLGSFLVAIGCAFVACSLAMTLSVYGRRPHEVLVMTYMIVMLWIMSPELVAIVHEVLVGPPPPVSAGPSFWTILYQGAEWSNPFILAMAPYVTPGRVGIGTYLVYLAACLVVSAGLTGLATARIRVVAMRQAGRPAGRPGWRILRIFRLSWLPGLPGPPLDVNPVAWREWHRMRPSLMMRIAWGLYAALGLFWLWVAWVPSTGPLRDRVGIVNMVQVTIGLFLLSAGAATSLSEERIRGSLDVLLSTPMSTRSILAGKWWGSFRQVLKVVIWPAATSPVLLVQGGDWMSYLALLGLVLAFGAAIASLGLALATWVSRLGRAVALCIAANIAWIVGWPFAVAIGVGTPAMRHTGMMLGDPPCGVLFGTFGIGPFAPPGVPVPMNYDGLLLPMVAWIVVIAGFSALLFQLTVATFDQCLGRASEGARPQPRRPGRSSLSPDELLALVPSASEGEYDGEPSQSLRS